MSTTTMEPTTTKVEQRVAKAEARLRRLIEDDATIHAQIVAQEALDRARRKADVDARRQAERLQLKAEVARDKSRAEATARRKAANEAERQLRESVVAPVAIVRYRGIEIRLDLERATDRTVRAFARNDLQAVLDLVRHDFGERQVGSSRAVAMGKTPSEPAWSTAKLTRDLADIIRRSIRLGNASIGVGRD